MVFYLVRHGQTDWNRERRLQGRTDIPLNETGIRQISELADRLVQEGIVFDRMIASPLARARQSAEIIAGKTGFRDPIILDENFMERSYGLLEGELYDPARDMDDPRYGAETVRELCARARNALDGYVFRKDERVMIVAHGAMLSAVKEVLSENRIGYHDRTVSVIQGNVLCCVKEEGREPSLFNLF